MLELPGSVSGGYSEKKISSLVAYSRVQAPPKAFRKVVAPYWKGVSEVHWNSLLPILLNAII